MPHLVPEYKRAICGKYVAHTAYTAWQILSCTLKLCSSFIEIHQKHDARWCGKPYISVSYMWST